MRLKSLLGPGSIAFALSLLAVGCRSPDFRRSITVRITSDGVTQAVRVRAGSTVAEALQEASIVPGQLDRSAPPLYAVLSGGDRIILTRVEEVLKTEQVAIPFARQTIRNETLADGEERLVQSGISGQQEVTFRRILEDGIEVSASVVKVVVLSEAVPEIVMVGAQASFTPLAISGTLAYLAGGNAWIMDTSTSNRRLLVSSGDLDGHIFALSPNGEYLIFTKKSRKPPEQEINTLWAVRTTSQNPNPIWLQAYNVVNFAAWIPGTNSIAYSTVEPRSVAPGWQANNDLYRVSLAGGGPRRMLDASSGGVYGWWGMTFAFSADGRLAYARPDEIGLVDQDGGYLKPFIDIVPLNTHRDWAWIPPLAWGSDGKTLFVATHEPAPAPVAAEESTAFALTAASLSNDATVALAEDTGMFAHPSASPMRTSGGEKVYQIAYLQAIFPDHSETSRYRLVVIDRDGSNRRVLFPPADAGGLEPQSPVWSPAPITGQTGDFLAVIFQGNLWLIDSENGAAHQVSGDGLVTRLDWR